jgi:hypothetical protein
MFAGVNYRTKTSPELRGALQRKLVALDALTAGRHERIKAIRDEYQIDADRLAGLIIQYQNADRSGFVSYEAQPGDRSRMVPAGVISSIVRETEMIDHERGQRRHAELILRNLRDEELYFHPETGAVLRREPLHELTDDELEYLGF